MNSGGPALVILASSCTSSGSCRHLPLYSIYKNSIRHCQRCFSTLNSLLPITWPTSGGVSWCAIRIPLGLIKAQYFYFTLNSARQLLRGSAQDMSSTCLSHPAQRACSQEAEPGTDQLKQRKVILSELMHTQ